MVGLLVGPNGPLAWAGEAIRSLDQMAYAEGGLGPSIGEHACLLLVTLFVANLRRHSDARDGRQLDLLVAVDLICEQHSVVLLAMIGGSGDGRRIGLMSSGAAMAPLDAFVCLGSYRGCGRVWRCCVQRT